MKSELLIIAYLTVLIRLQQDQQRRPSLQLGSPRRIRIMLFQTAGVSVGARLDCWLGSVWLSRSYLTLLEDGFQ